jgi:hypothetical protein
MTPRRLPRTLAGIAVAIGATLALAGCSGSEPEPEPTTQAPTTAPSTPAPEQTPEETPEPQADPTCETIIPADVVESFEDANWSFREEVFRVGATEVPDGITCTWGDMSVASDHVQMFGWAPVDGSQSTQLQSTLVQEGWLSEDGSAGTYITEDPDTVVAPDDDGYGWTYLFGDGWVTFADTKQGLVLVEWPPAG